MEKDWVLVFETNKDIEAEMVRGMLEENDISVFVINKKDSAYLFGNIELYVLPENLLVAKTYIKDFNL
ncbi:MAG TPA: DUF2007 domain-containing protein [Bacteroidales bacterium]|nr:DUF2007 domain-containing protein [Bacteroidales bacterium]HOH84468.1 DUF2007 domain-containing protein [Bacteroidales bacterium]HPB26327.1 DUF2007 domain-containing protein [Bacteroidales bacterium]HQP16588.1 DUF2007 domain-containing protein [Bacteroidales bacterium]